MSLSISIPKTAEQIPLDGLLVLTRTAIGLGIGMLVADKISRPVRQATAIALVSVGALAAVPFLVKMAMERINRPESERGSRNRLAFDPRRFGLSFRDRRLLMCRAAHALTRPRSVGYVALALDSVLRAA